jgi:chemotaxis protein MotB
LLMTDPSYIHTLHQEGPMTPQNFSFHRFAWQASLIASIVVMSSGCVSTDTHQKALNELDQAKKLAALQAEEMEALKRKSKAQSDQLQQQLSGLQQNLEQETSQRKNAEQQAASLEKEREALTARSTELQGRLDNLEREKGQLGSELGDVRAQIAALEKKLADEAAQVSALENDKQQLASGTATAQNEIIKLQQRAAELEAESARVVKERESLRQEQSRLSASLDQERQRVKAEEAEKARLAKEHEQLQQEQSELSATLDQERQRLKAEAEEKARLAKEREQLQQEQSQLSASLDQERRRLKAEAEDKARLERERAAKEDEIKRLTKTQEELSRSLQDEIAKGNITIQQVRDRLTINMVDRVLFDSGRAHIKPDGLKVLKQVSDVLNKVTDKQIRIEGHTDNVPISTKLQDKFKTNWELSTARATTVVRYLIDQGGVQPQTLSAVGYADTRPIAPNDSEEGRSSNRRIEIVLYPKDLSQIAGGLSANN